MKSACLFAIGFILLATVSAMAQSAPVIDPVNDTTVSEGGTLLLTITATDADEDNISFFEDSFPANATLADNGNNSASFEFNPDFTQSGDILFIIYATAGIDTVSESFTVAVTNVNRAPSFVDPGDQEIQTLGTFTLELTASDPDNDSIVLTMITAPIAADFTDNGDGTGLFSITPTAQQTGEFTFQFRANDTLNGSTTLDVAFQIVANNNIPEIDAIQDQGVTEGDVLTFEVTGRDPDGPYPRYELADDAPENMSIAPLTDSTAECTFAPSFVQSGIYDVIIIATDGFYADSTTVNIQVVEAGNQPPDIIVPDGLTVAEMDTLEVLISAIDPEGDPATLTLYEGPENSDFVSNGDGTGVFTFMPDYSQGGPNVVKFRATDSTAGSLDFRVRISTDTITVTEVDFPPIISPIGPKTIGEGYYLDLHVTATDPEGEDVFVSVGELPPMATFEPYPDGSGRFLFNPDYQFVETYQTIQSVTFYSYDSYDVDSEHVIITVTNVEKDPQDPGEADTLTFESRSWDGVGDLPLDCFVWNDSAIAGGLTGFTWDDTSLVCDSVVLNPAILTASYKEVFINNSRDSLSFVISFYYTDSMSFAPPGGLYFTAWFHYDGVWNPESIIHIDSAKNGSAGDFVFDGGLNAKLDGSFDYPNMKALFAAASDSYVPLVYLGELRAPVAADDDTPVPLPLAFKLEQNYPNPFNPATTIAYSLPHRSDVTITVFNILGQVVRVLKQGEQEAGTHAVVWDGTDGRGKPAASGIYLYHMVADEFMSSRKMILLK